MASGGLLEPKISNDRYSSAVRVRSTVFFFCSNMGQALGSNPADDPEQERLALRD